MTRPPVLAIILNYNGTEDTLECLASLARSEYLNLQTLVVDNASDPDPMPLFASRFPKAELLRSELNLGYAGGNNLGVQWAAKKNYEHVLILNNDVTVDPKAVDELVNASEANLQATILAPKVLFYDKPDMINSCGTSMDWFRLRPRLGLCGQKDEGQCGNRKEAVILPGSALFFTKKLWESTGHFDEDFFLIHEDAELCLRNRQKGFKNLLVPEARVFHKTSRTLSKYPFLTEYYSIRNFLLLAKLRATSFERLFACIGLLILFFKNSALLIGASKEQRERVRGFFKGATDYWAGKKGPYGKQS